MIGADWASAAPARLEDLGLGRRQLVAGGLASLTLALLGCRMSSARPSARMAARDWLDRQQELALTLARGELSPAAWMTEAERLAGEIEVAQLMAELDQAQVSAMAAPPTNDPRKYAIRFRDAAGAPRKLRYAAALFRFEPGNVITPHGHRHMVSSHLVVEGRFRVRNFDRIRDEDDAMIVKPTRDYLAGTGQLSAMSSQRDNIHWFVPQGGAAATFDVIISGLDPGQPDYVIEAIDPLGGARRPDGTIRAPKIDFVDASRRYPAAV